MRTHALYRFFADDGDLLYVGITMNPATRWPQHRATKPWWHEVTTVTLETFPSRQEVLDAEREAIKTEHPRYNIALAEREQVPPTPETLTWTCAECGDVVDDHEGSLWVAATAVSAYEAELEEWEATSGPTPSFGAYVRYPDAAPWQATHFTCDQDDDYLYAIPIEEVRRATGMLAYTAHLMGKTWLSSTRWDLLLLRKAGAV